MFSDTGGTSSKKRKTATSEINADDFLHARRPKVSLENRWRIIDNLLEKHFGHDRPFTVVDLGRLLQFGTTHRLELSEPSDLGCHAG